MIGRRPYAAFGNSTGDRQMLEYTTAGAGARLGMLVLHDDARREYAYGPATGLPDSKVGTFTQALYDEARKKGWAVISMKDDWKRVFPFDGPARPEVLRVVPEGALAAAELTVVVPADAEVFVDGELTRQKGTERRFTTPPLVGGKRYTYDVRARWKEGGKPVEQTRKVPVRAGARVRVDFLSPPPETVPTPRQSVPKPTGETASGGGRKRR
jgi:uncharacterized protein (TIGR03000 family)